MVASKNTDTPTTAAGTLAVSQPPVVWLLTDDRPGHQSQLRGLGERLQALAGAELHHIPARQHPLSLAQLWRGSFALPAAPPPSLILAAGHGTHRLLLALRRRLGVPAVVLMKPSFPLAWVDGAIIPAHDNPPLKPHVLAVQGVLNSASPASVRTTDKKALILAGGPSRHFRWDSEALAWQIQCLCQHYPDWQWTLVSSRRTPPGLGVKLQSLAALQQVAPEDTGPHWLPAQLQASRVAWVTPDSASMVSEALTSGLATGLLALPPRRRSRVARGVQALVEAGTLHQWPDHTAVMAADAKSGGLWEADRAARWLIRRFFPGAAT